MGDKGSAQVPGVVSGATEQASAQSARLGALAERNFWQTEPLRQVTKTQLMGALQGKPIDQFTTLRPAREAIASQFGQAREDILTSGARGGQLRQQLRDVDVARAGAVTGLETQARQQAFQQALSTGFGSSGVALSGMGAAASGLGQSAGTLAQSYSAAAQQRAAEQQAMGLGTGAMAGLMLAKCWVAAALYGLGSERYWIARYCIFVRLKGWRGRLVRAAYQRWGPWIADCGVAWVLRPVFDRLRI